MPNEHARRGTVVIGAGAHDGLVARVGHFAASAFVTLALDAAPDRRGVLVVETSTRSLARRLDVAKDTAGGVLAALVRGGYLRRRVQPRSAGRFAPARYTLRPPAGFSLAPAGGTSPRPDSPPTAARRSRTRPVTGRGEADQLGLFSAAAEAPDPGDHR